MKPGRYDLPTIWRGSTYSTIYFRWLDANGNAIGLTGWTPLAKSKTIDFHPEVTNPLAGITALSLTKEETANLDLGVQEWDWVWIHADGSRTNPLIFGYVEVKEPTAQGEGTT